MIRSLTELQKGWIFYLITLGLALLVALFGPTGPIQILNMLTVTAGVLLMLLVITPDGYHKAGWAQLGLHRAGWRYGTSQRGPRSAGGRSCGRQPEYRRIRHRRDWRVHPSRAGHSDVDADEALGGAKRRSSRSAK